VAVALLPRELDEILCLREHRAVLWRAGNGDAAAAPELEQALVAESAERAEDGVGVDAENGGKVFRGRQALARLCLAVCDRSSDLAGDLLVEIGPVASVDLDIPHDAIHSSIYCVSREAMSVTSPPSAPETRQNRDLEQRVADLEALIEEARRRALRRRIRNGAAALLVAATGAVAFIGFGGHGGGGPGTAAVAHAPGAQAPAANADSAPLGALPPDAGRPESFVFDPRNPKVVYVLAVGSSTGTSHVFKTIDGGAHWLATAARSSDWMGFDEALTADPQHPGTLYAGTELAVYKTVDGGDSWRPSNRGLFTPPRPTDRAKGWMLALAVDPADTRIVYAGSDRVSKSIDGGRSWKTVFPPHATRHPAENVSALAIAPTRPEAIYAITGEFPNPSPTPAGGPFSIYKSTDAGATWQATTTVRGSVTQTALAVDPRHPTTVYAAVGANVLKTTNAGETWQSIAYGLPLGPGGVRALAVDPRRSGTVYAALTQGGIYKTTNGGQTWIHATGTMLDMMFAVAVNPARPATIYAAGQSEMGGSPQIFKSTDGGHTWTTAP
jgi:hypothetical protein